MYSNKRLYHCSLHFILKLIIIVSLRISSLAFNQKISFLYISVLSLIAQEVLDKVIPLMWLTFSLKSFHIFISYLLHPSFAMVTVPRKSISKHILNFIYHLFYLAQYLNFKYLIPK